MFYKTFNTNGLATLNLIGRIQRAVELIDRHFGHDEFTTKDFQSVKAPKGVRSCLKTMRDYGIIKVSREETYEGKLKYPRHTVKYTNDTGSVIFSEDDWAYLSHYKPEAWWVLIQTTNGGRPYTKKMVEVSTFTGKRYFYTVDYNRLRELIEQARPNCEKALDKAIQSTARKLDNLRKSKAAFEHI